MFNKDLGSSKISPEERNTISLTCAAPENPTELWKKLEMVRYLYFELSNTDYELPERWKKVQADLRRINTITTLLYYREIRHGFECFLKESFYDCLDQFKQILDKAEYLFIYPLKKEDIVFGN